MMPYAYDSLNMIVQAFERGQNPAVYLRNLTTYEGTADTLTKSQAAATSSRLPRVGRQERQAVIAQGNAAERDKWRGAQAMSRTTFVRIVIAAFIILVLAAASVIVVRNDAASQADAPSGFVH